MGREGVGRETEWMRRSRKSKRGGEQWILAQKEGE
jgi:hypothetical protein